MNTSFVLATDKLVSSFFKSNHFTFSFDGNITQQPIAREDIQKYNNIDDTDEPVLGVVSCHGCHGCGYVSASRVAQICPVCEGHGKLYIDSNGIVYSLMPMVKLGGINGECEGSPEEAI